MKGNGSSVVVCMRQLQVMLCLRSESPQTYEPAAQGSPTDPLICSTDELDIINGTSYRAFAALSNRWGDGTTPRAITLNNHLLSIG